MLLTLPAAKCVVMSSQEDILKGEKGEHAKPHSENHSQLAMALILIMPDGKEVRLLVKDCDRGQVQLTLPDES